MIIDRIELYHVAMPLLEPWRTAYGEDADIHAILCRICSGSLDAWGEAAPFAAPCYSAECAAAAFVVARDWLAPAVLGQDVKSGDDIQRLMAIYKGNPFARATLDTAWWSLQSKASGTSLAELLGASRSAVPVGADFGVMDSVDELLVRIAGAVEQGFPRLKLKFRPGWDGEMVRRVRAEFPDLTMHIDCNSGYTLSDVDQFRDLDELELAMIEQPLQHDDLLDHASLQKEIATPVCLDESIRSVHLAEQAISLGSCQYINIKPGRVGGLTPALAIHNLAQKAEIPCWVGGMLESAVGSAHCAALAMLENFSYPADIFPSSRFYAEDLADPPLELTTSVDGVPSVAAPLTLPAPRAERLTAATVQQETLQLSAR
jgi:O-succinylbenzoate synthase